MNFHKSLIQDCISDIFLLEKMNGGDFEKMMSFWEWLRYWLG